MYTKDRDSVGTDEKVTNRTSSTVPCNYTATLTLRNNVCSERGTESCVACTLT